MKHFGTKWVSSLSTESSDGAPAGNLPWIRAVWRTERTRNRAESSHLQDSPPSDGKGAQDLSGNDRLVPVMDLQLWNNSETFI